MKYSDVAGTVSAAALGYIHGGVRGAKMAVNSFNSLRKKSDMKRKSGTSLNLIIPRKKHKQMLHKKKNHALTVYKKHVPARIVRKKKSVGKVSSFRNVLQGISQHNDWTKRPYRHCVIGRKKSFQKTVGSFNLAHSYNKIFASTEGRQATGFVSELLNFNQLNASTTTDLRFFDTQWATDPFQLNPYSTAPNNAIYTAVPPAVVASDKLYIRSIDHELRFVSMTNIAQRVKVYYSTAPNNAIYTAVPPAVVASDKLYIRSIDHELRFVSMTNIAQRVKVYYMLCNMNTDKDVSTIWGDCLAKTEGYLQTVNTTLISIAALGGVTSAGSEFTSDVGETPFKSTGFRKFFKLLHKDQFILQPGDQQQINMKFHINKMIVKQQLADMDASTRLIRGFTIIPYVIVDGALVGIATVGGTATQIGPGAPKVGMLARDNYHFAALPVNRFTIQRAEVGYLRNDTVDDQKTIDDTDKVVLQTLE
ncbi:ORF2 [Ninurtavirus momolo]|nr:ORF2 [Molossus molossus associated CRESS DNA virus]